ncbi:DUF1541 domain-containing protein [Aquibacillus koreensis]|uniref:DUF1541 domain-containing protein n=1 Tax=Aquibacillus koreensis TaxID=279446 RepID=A0A9X4AIL0_9BACI|nr:YdhK family protein [Aquibacillus koreensis]MCT2538207.1 DUF1541 domain-containing protein [Aquibacillus koreensis]MDC3420849.1 DUF1541 domain-containing protein [Aquibacillus koreensis]
MRKLVEFTCFSLLFIGLFFYFIHQHPDINAIVAPEKYNATKMNHHAGMIYQGSADVPDSLSVADDPTFPIGTQAISIADHMGGMMDNIDVTIVGAYETTAYATTFTSAMNGEVVQNHKWIVHEELVGVGDEILSPGTKVVTTAAHMMGMKEATHTINFSETTTVYMVDFFASNGQQVTNHKWVTEEELR